MARNLLPIMSGMRSVLGASVSNNLIVAMVVSWLCLGSLLFFIRRTHLGRAIRAISEDPKGAIVSGIDLERANLVTWIWAGGLAAIAGIFFGSYTQLLPHMWLFPLIMSFAIVIVGGIGSIEGSIIAAYIVGMSETALMMAISEQLRGVFGMSIMIAILVIRPRGLLGKEM
jgi:branched-chain amino acid transport system permease protein